jgi:hypothetical protein
MVKDAHSSRAAWPTAAADGASLVNAARPGTMHASVVGNPFEGADLK